LLELLQAACSLCQLTLLTSPSLWSVSGWPAGSAAQRSRGSVTAHRTAAVAGANMPAPIDVRNILGKNPSDPRLEDLYVLDKQIGKGAFGVVRLGHNKATGDPVAVKSISKAKLSCKEDIQDVQAEVAIMNLVAGHSNVVMLQVCWAVSVC